jgi:hypothetical protein
MEAGEHEHASLQEAQLAVMASVPYIQKQSSGGLRYTFASEAELIKNLHPAMRLHGITVHPDSVEVISQEPYEIVRNAGRPDEKRTRMMSVRATVAYVFQHGSDSEQVTVLAEASDAGDKASSKLMTIALKYALRQFFLIETGDDPDTEAHNRATVADVEVKAREKISAAKTMEELDVLQSAAEGKAPELRSKIMQAIERQRKLIALSQTDDGE